MPAADPISRTPASEAAGPAHAPWRRLGRWILTGLFWLIVCVLLATVIIPPFLDRLYYQGPETAHYDGERFHNPGVADPPSLSPQQRLGFFRRLLTGSGRIAWPDHVAVRQAKPPALAPCARMNGAITENWGRCAQQPADPQRMVVTWVGHATMLVQTQGLAILTDPIWSDRAGPYGIGPKRVSPPGIAWADLPRIDLVLVSHNHYDHMDLATLKALYDRDRPRIVTSLGNDTILKAKGIPATALDWGQRVPVRPGIDAIVTRNHHWGSRWGKDRNRALWSSFVVTLPGGNLFFAGDTGFGDGQWPAEAAAYGPIRLALLPIGAFRFQPGGMSISSHIGPLEAAEVHHRLGAATSFAIHWGTFQLSQEAWDTPPRLLAAVMRCRGLTGFRAIPIGLPMDVSPYAPQPPGKPTGADCAPTSALWRPYR